MNYLREIEIFINEIDSKLKSITVSFFDKSHILQELKTERERTEKDYQKLKTGDYVKYLVTDIFEDEGILKYTKIAAGVFSEVFNQLLAFGYIN